MSDERGDRLRVLSGGKESVGSAKVLIITSREAIVRGLKTFAFTVLAALCTIIIPGVHFLSVPGGLIAAPILAVFVFMKSRGSIRGVSGSFFCPSCGEANILEYQEGKPPYFGSCHVCKNPYQAFPA